MTGLGHAKACAGRSPQAVAAEEEALRGLSLAAVAERAGRDPFEQLVYFATEGAARFPNATFEPVPDLPFELRCRGQVVPGHTSLVYEARIKEALDRARRLRLGGNDEGSESEEAAGD